MTAQAIEQGSDVPEAARELTNKGIAPPRMYNWIVNRKWKQEGRSKRVDLNAKPHSLISPSTFMAVL